VLLIITILVPVLIWSGLTTAALIGSGVLAGVQALAVVGNVRRLPL